MNTSGSSKILTSFQYSNTSCPWANCVTVLERVNCTFLFIGYWPLTRIYIKIICLSEFIKIFQGLNCREQLKRRFIRILITAFKLLWEMYFFVYFSYRWRRSCFKHTSAIVCYQVQVIFQSRNRLFTCWDDAYWMESVKHMIYGLDLLHLYHHILVHTLF